MKTLLVDVQRQMMELREGADLRASFPISTSKFGLGAEEGSHCTPLGDFYICEKYGTRAPPGAIFKGRKAVGQWQGDEGDESDYVLTRILRLASHEPGLTNTYQRYIYLHGTNQEQLIGSPASHGCVRMTNSDIANLYPLIPVGTPMTIYHSLHS